MIYLSCAKAGVQHTRQQLEVQRYLKKLNKPAIKSIKMRPSFQPFDLDDENEVALKKKTSSITQLWHQNGRCPWETIPIRRTKMEDVLRASSIERFGKKRSNAIPNSNSILRDGYIHEHSFALVNGQKYYGTSVFMDVWNPFVQEPGEFSNTQFWVVADPFEDQNTIEAGWHVYPNLYGDNRTRLFIYWTTDNYNRTGCHNLQCSGFIQVNNEIALGSSIYPISSYGGPQYGIDLSLFKEPQTGYWWLQYGKKTLGYWPSTLFSHLSYATSVLWGAEIINFKLNGKHTSTVMGSGHFGKEGHGKASFCSNIKILDEALTPADPQGVVAIAESPNCYDVRNATNFGDLGTHFYYGGPGKNPNCP
ncbi:hypothetical protein COCNU_14G012490 [Cocos nucifera]|uniref:Neprosin PEP catalytic domain-containing protein n=1 Tax=Cocos nucifera TaxID=13894 RepID=A0A8K0IWB8_COCNU|nr:hypothetical protein COCNU_14G012490 [Cocos nucifera]